MAWVPLSHAVVFRCEVPGSSGTPVVQYQASPCDGGHAVEATDTRSAHQLAQAQSTAKSDAKLARKLEKSREAQEKKAAGQTAVGIDTVPKPLQATVSPAGKADRPRKEKHFTAVTPKKHDNDAQ